MLLLCDKRDTPSHQIISERPQANLPPLVCVCLLQGKNACIFLSFYEKGKERKNFGFSVSIVRVFTHRLQVTSFSIFVDLSVFSPLCALLLFSISFFRLCRFPVPLSSFTPFPFLVVGPIPRVPSSFPP